VRGVYFDLVLRFNSCGSISQSTVEKFEQGRCQPARILFNQPRKPNSPKPANAFRRKKIILRTRRPDIERTDFLLEFNQPE
jgi:hypothetical protein